MGHKYLFSISALLLSFDCSVSEVNLPKGAIIKRLASIDDFTAYQKQYRQALVDTGHPLGIALAPVNPQFMRDMGLSYVLEYPYELDLPQGQALEFNKYVERISRIITAMRLFQAGCVGVSEAHTKIVEGPSYRGMAVVDSFPPEYRGKLNYKYVLQRPEEFVKFYSNLEKNMPIKEVKMIRAIRWFNMAYMESYDMDKLVDYVVALESIYGTGSDHVASCCSSTIGSSSEEMSEITMVLKQSYRLRSKVVHGAGVSEETLREIVPKVEDLARRSITERVTIDTRTSSTLPIHR